MSTSYNLEPQPTAKVLLQTTSGDVVLELFAKQTPLTSRNFVQLCLDGYYVGTLFHRLLPGFIIQGGDPTGTGEGGESIYDDGRPFADEFHSRLKFNRRGLLGMANGGGKDDNTSQFFLTLAKAEELNGKNTMFGRVEGDTIYNLVKMGEAELAADQGSERPLYPTKITGTEVLVNPFEDMVKRELSRRAAPADVERGTAQGSKKRKPAKKTGKTLLSFAGDEGEDEAPLPVAKKAKFNTKLVDASANDVSAHNGLDAVEQKAAAVPGKESPSSSSLAASKDHQAQRRSEPARARRSAPAKAVSSSPSASPEPEPVAAVSSLLEKTNAQIADLKASMRRTVETGPREAPSRKKTALEQMIPETSIRGRRRRHGAAGRAGPSNGPTGLEDDDRRALDLLNAFRAKLDNAPAEQPTRQKETKLGGDVPPRTGTVGKAHATKAEGSKDEDEEARLCDLHFISNCQSCQSWDRRQASRSRRRHRSQKRSTSHSPARTHSSRGSITSSGADDGDGHSDNDTGWMSHALTFEKDRLGKDLTWRKQNQDELVVIDPREKGKDIMEMRRGEKKKRPTEAAGGARSTGR